MTLTSSLFMTGLCFLALVLALLFLVIAAYFELRKLERSNAALKAAEVIRLAAKAEAARVAAKAKQRAANSPAMLRPVGQRPAIIRR